ncbi:hypothetical protein PG995_000781 [Apiospora arundinis]|uniref:Uncharacterized protein n=1 Tax=Apiospora arundinis TaxID=335852 RepID=A0ABR2JAF5_9PEZI
MAGLPSEENIMMLESIHKCHTIHTNLRSTYGTRWEPWEAFRELVQNWRDGIIRSFDLDEKEFKVIREQKSEFEILYKALAPADTHSGQCLGYIRFSGNEKGGRVELVNRNASIQPGHFDLGGTTKRDDKNQAGVHGDGLKVALLVLMRAPQRHEICFTTGGFRWEPNFDKYNKLVINLTRLQTYDITMEERSSKPEFQEGLIPLLASPLDDVKFIIGLGDSVKVRDFHNWTKAALFLQEIGDDDIVSVAEGDLISSKHPLRGNLYLKGLLLKASKVGESASLTGKRLRFGYNFANGETNRDRQSLPTAGNEAKAIAAIWTSIIQKKPDLISELSHMLDTRKPEYADISHAGTFLQKEVIDKLKNHLTAAPFEKRWYYTLNEMNENTDLLKTIRGFGRVPKRLEESYWGLLHFRTAEEEQRSRFLKQEEEAIPDTPFAKDVHWYLSACLGSCGPTESARFICVEGAGLDPTTMWEKVGGLARIHRSWFLQDQAATELGLSTDTDPRILVSNTVKKLFRSLTLQIEEEKFGPSSASVESRSCAWHKETTLNRVEQRLLDCIQLKKHLTIKLTGPSHDPSLLVTWGSDAAWKLDKDFIRVEVHRASECAHLKYMLLAGEHKSAEKSCLSRGIQRPSEVQTCGIAGHYYQSDGGQVTLSGLKENEEYFAMIYNSSEPSSFTVVSENTVVLQRVAARPPSRLPPLPPSLFRAPSPSPSPSLLLPPPAAVPVVDNKRTYTLGEELDNINIVTPRKWFEATNAEGQEAVVGIPPQNAPKFTQKKTAVKRSASQSGTAKRPRHS